MNFKTDKPIKCRACGEYFIREKYKGTAKYCPNPECQEEKKIRSNKRQRQREKENKLKPTKKIKRTKVLCSCCRIKNVPIRKVKGVYLTRLCEDCFRRGESDVLSEHRVLIDK